MHVKEQKSMVKSAAEGVPYGPCRQLIALSKFDLQPPDGQRQLESGARPEASHPLDELLGRLCAPEADLRNPDVLHRSLEDDYLMLIASIVFYVTVQGTILRGSCFYAAACRRQSQAAQQETVCNTSETASKRVSLLSSGGIKGETVSHLGKMHMDALRDKQPDFVDVNTHMSIPCYPG